MDMLNGLAGRRTVSRPARAGRTWWLLALLVFGRPLPAAAATPVPPGYLGQLLAPALEPPVLTVQIPPDISLDRLLIVVATYGKVTNVDLPDVLPRVRDYPISLKGATSAKVLIWARGYRMVTGEFDVAKMGTAANFVPRFVKVPMVPLRVRLTDAKGRPLSGESVVLRLNSMALEYLSPSHNGSGPIYFLNLAAATIDDRGEIRVEVPSILDDPYFSGGRRWMHSLGFEPYLPHREFGHGWDFVPMMIPPQREYPGVFSVVLKYRGEISGRLTDAYAARACAQLSPGKKIASPEYSIYAESNTGDPLHDGGAGVEKDGSFSLNLPAGRWNLFLEIEDEKPFWYIGRVPIAKDFVLGEGEHRVLELK